MDRTGWRIQSILSEVFHRFYPKGNAEFLKQFQHPFDLFSIHREFLVLIVQPVPVFIPVERKRTRITLPGKNIYLFVMDLQDDLITVLNLFLLLLVSAHAKSGEADTDEYSTQNSEPFISFHVPLLIIAWRLPVRALQPLFARQSRRFRFPDTSEETAQS